MQLQQYLRILNPTSITQSLQSILTTLQQEYVDLKISYQNKINLLQSDIKDKDKQLDKLNKQLEKINQRCQNLQVKNNEQNTIIQGLGLKVKNFKKIMKNKFNQYLDQLDFQEDIDKLLNQTQENKKINISKYFINVLENSKSSTKIQNQTPSDSSDQMYCSSWLKPNYKVQKIQSTNFDKIYAKIQSPKISRIKSLDQNRFLRQIQTLNLNFQNLNNQNKNPRRSQVEYQSNIKSIQKNIHPRQIIGSKKQRKCQIENKSNKKVYLPTKIQNTASKWKKFSAFRDEDIYNKFILNQDLK